MYRAPGERNRAVRQDGAGVPGETVQPCSRGGQGGRCQTGRQVGMGDSTLFHFRYILF